MADPAILALADYVQGDNLNFTADVRQLRLAYLTLHGGRERPQDEQNRVATLITDITTNTAEYQARRQINPAQLARAVALANAVLGKKKGKSARSPPPSPRENKDKSPPGSPKHTVKVKGVTNRSRSANSTRTRHSRISTGGKRRHRKTSKKCSK